MQIVEKSMKVNYIDIKMKYLSAEKMEIGLILL